jgi:hypothetical protein
MVLHEYPSNMLPSYDEMVHVNVVGNSQQIDSNQVSSAKQCMIKCGGNPDCNYFEFSGGNQCTYYSAIGDTGDSFGNVLYSKIQPANINNNCPFLNTVDKISTSDWEYYVKGEMLTPSSSCFTRNDNYLNNEIIDLQNTANNTQKELLLQSEQTNSYLNNWNKSSTGFEKRIIQNKKLSDDINKMQGTYKREGFNTIGTTQAMLDESIEIQKRNRYRNIFWTFITITVIIMTLRLIQLYTK